MVVPMIDAPLPHPGTDHQIRRNRLTHQWHTLDSDDYRCLVCDANAYGETANYPCGQEPPRQAGHIPVQRFPVGRDAEQEGRRYDPTYESDTPDWGHTP